MMTKAKTKTESEDSLFKTNMAPDPTVPPKKKEVVVVRAASARVVPITDDANIWQIIERLSINKDVDAEKLEKLLAVAERMAAKKAETAFDQAMILMQPELPVITKDGRIIVKEKDAAGRRTGAETQNTPYAKWEKIAALLKPIMHQHGFSLTHRSETAPDGRLRVTAIIKGHGHTDDRCYLDLQADVTGSKNNAQGWASALSYAKRHTTCAALNIITRDEDDDARATGKPITVGESMSPEQAERVIDLCVAVECTKVHFLKHMNADDVRPRGHPIATEIDQLPASRFDEAIAALRGYEANKKARAKKAAEEAAKEDGK
jgi:hypothetical protein